MSQAQSIRNVAIIAHVDHGKTTLVDALLRQSKTHLQKDVAAVDLIMDSNELERERGITIFSKNASMVWNGVKINIIDTPGHADFGGEVERVLNMADGCLLLVDSKEGPMPQTRFVLKKALARGMRIIVVINKIDKADSRPDETLTKTFDLFVELGANDRTLDFPVLYASSKEGKAGPESDLSAMTGIVSIFETIVKDIPAPTGDAAKPLQMLVTTLANDQFLGRIAIGRVANGVIAAGQNIVHINRLGVQESGRITSLMTFRGLERIETESISAGDIAAVAGIPDATIGETIADPLNPAALPLLDIDEPTVKMTFSPNDSPFVGREGTYCTSRQIEERLDKELETDLALRVSKTDRGWIVSGRGELHLAILIERLRREGYELQVSRPQVILKEIEGKTHAPFERAYLEVPEAYGGAIIQNLNSRQGVMQDMETREGITYLEFVIPTRGLFGFRSEFLTATRGLGLINTAFEGYQPVQNVEHERTQGSLVAHENGVSTLYGLLNVQDRGQFFIGPAVEVYKGQVVGQNSRAEDIRVNVCKTKQLSNMRSKGEGGQEHFRAPKVMGLEDALEYISDDELVEATPKSIRIRKRVLDETLARKLAKS